MEESYEERLERRKSQVLPWISNPLHYFRRHLEQEEHGISHALRPSGLLFTERKLENAEEIEEATPIELFYDLFFVANLTTVTSIQHITQDKTLAAYAFTFSILWFTWLHVTLYDVRFAVDSVYERVCKAVHFGVMVGFASVSTAWNPFDPDNTTVGALKQMTIILLISRAVLGVQYFIVMLYAWRYKNTTKALAIHSGAMFLSSIIYLGLFFGFHPNPNNRAYVGWYVAIVLEAAMVVITSCVWRVVSFKRTHLVERMCLLTLIVLGEGIIVMLKAINTVVESASWDGHIVGIIIAAIAIIVFQPVFGPLCDVSDFSIKYFLYMFYFDYTPRNTHYGSIRQQIWALLHFPFHLATVLVMEGLRQLTIWWSFYSGVTYYYNFLTTEEMDTAIPELKSYFEELYDDGASKTILKDYSSIMAGLDTLASGNYTTENRTELVDFISNILFTGLAEFYEIETESGENSTEAASAESIQFFRGPLRDVGSLYVLVYHYFFVSLGVMFLGYGMFAVLVRRQKDVYDYIAIAFRGAAAVVFFSLSSMYHHGLDGEGKTLLLSPWPVPTVCLVLAIVLILDKLLNYVAYHNMKEHKPDEVVANERRYEQQRSLPEI